MIAKTRSAPKFANTVAIELSQSFRVVIMASNFLCVASASSASLRFMGFFNRRGAENAEATQSLFLIQNPQPIICCIRLHRWLVHQLRAGGCDLEFAGNLDAHRVLQRRVAVKVIHEDRRAVVAELT